MSVLGGQRHCRAAPPGVATTLSICTEELRLASQWNLKSPENIWVYGRFTQSCLISGTKICLTSNWKSFIHMQNEF